MDSIAAVLARTAAKQGGKAGNEAHKHNQRFGGVSPISKKPYNGFFSEKFIIRGKLTVKQKLMVTDLTVPLNVGELRGYLALIQSTFL